MEIVCWSRQTYDCFIYEHKHVFISQEINNNLGIELVEAYSIKMNHIVIHSSKEFKNSIGNKNRNFN